MKISAATASSLGDKLAGLNLSDEEGALLTALLGRQTEAEVEGFRDANPDDPRIMFETFRKTGLPQVLGPLPRAWKPESSDWIIIQS